MDIVVIGLIILVVFILFLSYKKREYHRNKKEPDDGGIDADGASGDGNGDGGA